MELIDLVGASGLSITFFVGVVVSLVELVKRTLGTASKYSPILSLALGVTLVVAFLGTEFDVMSRVFLGIIVGLTASGLYSGVKTVKA